MKPTLITNVHFTDEMSLSEFLVSTETTANEVRTELVARIKSGEGLMAIIVDSPPQALVLRYTIEKGLKGTEEGDEIVATSFA